jgi:hypothetical protein
MSVVELNAGAFCSLLWSPVKTKLWLMLEEEADPGEPVLLPVAL